MSTDYDFFFDESFHDRKITAKQFARENFLDYYIGLFWGTRKSNIPAVTESSKKLNIQQRNSSLFRVSLKALSSTESTIPMDWKALIIWILISIIPYLIVALSKIKASSQLHRKRGIIMAERFPILWLVWSKRLSLQEIYLLAGKIDKDISDQRSSPIAGFL